jgi:Transposase DDE domain
MHTPVAAPVAALIATLRRRLHDARFCTRHRARPADFTRLRRLPFQLVVLFVLQKSVQSLQRHVRAFFAELAAGDEAAPATPGACTHARAKLRHTAFIELNRDCVLPAIYGPVPARPVQRWHGHRVLGVDSSLVRLPAHPRMETEFSVVEATNGLGPTGVRYAEGRLAVLYDVLNRVGLDGRLAPSATGEIALATEQLAHAARGDVVLSDRGFTGYRFLAEQHRLGLHFVARCSRRSFFAAQELFRRDCAGRSVTVQVPAPRAEHETLAQAGLPLTLTVRFVSVRLPTGELEVLATNLHDPAAYPTKEFGALYHQRWGHETYYGLLKGRLELENFSGLTPEAVRQDFFATLLLCNLESVLTAPSETALREASADHAHPKQVNRAESFHALKRALLPLLYSDTPVEEVVAQLHACFAGSPVSVRPKRKVLRRTPSLARAYHFLRRVKKSVF